MERRTYEEYAAWEVAAHLFKESPHSGDEDTRLPEESRDPPYDLLLPPGRPDYRNQALHRVRQSPTLQKYQDTLLELPFELGERRKSGEQLDYYSSRGPERALSGTDLYTDGFWFSVANFPEENHVRWSEGMRQTEFYAQWQRERPEHPPRIPEESHGPDAHCECRRLLRKGKREETCARMLLTTRPGRLPKRFPCPGSFVLEATHTWYACDRYPPIERLPSQNPDPWLRVWWHLNVPLAGGSVTLAKSREQLAQVRGVTRVYARKSIPKHPLLDDPGAQIGLVLDRHFDNGTVTLFGLVQEYQEEHISWLKDVGYELVIRRHGATGESGGHPPGGTELLAEADDLASWYDGYAFGVKRKSGRLTQGMASYPDTAEFEASVLAAVAACRTRSLSEPTQVEVAGELRLSRETFNRLLKAHAVDWHRVKLQPN